MGIVKSKEGKLSTTDNDKLMSVLKKLDKAPKKAGYINFNDVITAGVCYSCYDGDTANFILKMPKKLKCLHQEEWVRFRCRMIGYNCEEIRSKNEEKKKKAIEARDNLRKLILNKKCILRFQGFDKYGRLLTDVYLPDGKDFFKNHVNQIMIDSGDGVVYNP